MVSKQNKTNTSTHQINVFLCLHFMLLATLLLLHSQTNTQKHMKLSAFKMIIHSNVMPLLPIMFDL